MSAVVTPGIPGRSGRAQMGSNAINTRWKHANTQGALFVKVLGMSSRPLVGSLISQKHGV